MKKFLVILAVVMFAAFSVSAGALTAPTMYGPSYWECDTGFAYTDSLSAVDTLTLATKRLFEPGYEYALSVKVTTETADSILFECLTYGSDAATLMNTAHFDIIGASATDKIALMPIGRTVIGARYTIRARSWIAGKVARFARVEFWGRKLNQK